MLSLNQGCRLAVWGIVALVGVGLGATLPYTGWVALIALTDSQSHISSGLSILYFVFHLLAFMACLRTIPRLWPFEAK